MSKTPKITIPDLRFEQSFMRSLNNYATAKVKPLSDAELLEEPERTDEETPQIKPLEPITPGIVIFAIIKDQLFMPLLQGFLLSGFYIVARPLLRLVIANGQSAGRWVHHMLGLGAFSQRRRPYAMP